MELAAAVAWPSSTQVLPSKVSTLSNAVKQKMCQLCHILATKAGMNVPSWQHPGNFPELSPRETLSVGNFPHKILSCPGLCLMGVSSRKRSRTEAGTSPWSRFVLKWPLATSGEARTPRRAPTPPPGGGVAEAEPLRRGTARQRRGGGVLGEGRT